MTFFKKIIIFIAGVLVCAGTFYFSEKGTAYAASSRGGYEINSYDCYYRVSDDNVYHVIETIDVTFTEYRHGIYRNIPEVNRIERLDGTRDTVISEVDVLTCSDFYSDYRDGDDRVIKIGKKDEEIIGQHTYTLQYDVYWGNDRVADKDEFYMNLIGNGWDVPVRNLTFTIEFPFEFEDTGDNIGFYYGPYSSSRIEGIRYSFDGKTIRGSLVGYEINPGYYFTTRIELEDGYFLVSSELPFAGVLALVFCCLFLAISLVVWLRVGKDDDIIEVAEFYPPDGLNCAEMAYCYYGKVTNKDCVPMLIGLAAKGYIEITETDNRGDDFIFRVLKEYEGTDETERVFLNGLKKYGAVVTKKELENSFYKTLEIVCKKITNTFESKIFYKNSLLWRYITLPFAWIPHFVGLYAVIKRYTGDWFPPVIYLGVFCLMLTAVMFTVMSKKVPIVGRVIFGVLGAAGIAVHVWLIKDSLNYAGSFYWVVYIGCVLAHIGQMVFFGIIDKRTDYGIDLLGRIRGFRNYLATAERPHLVSLVYQDPQYYYKILPYTYTLGITDIWVDQFESIAMEPPNWYYSPYGSTFHYRSFNSFLRKTMTNAQSSMTSTPHSSGSGGGFSGGGGGGGGGGSW